MDDVIVKADAAAARMTFAEFATFYDRAPPDERWELIDGEAIRMAPASTTHIRIAGALKDLLNARLAIVRPDWYADTEHGARDRDIEDYAPQPDVLVSDFDYAENQIWSERFYFVVEVLSDDRARVLERKRSFYRAHAHCRGFLFVSQTEIAAELVTRNSEGWVVQKLGPVDVIDIPDIGAIGKLVDGYRTTKLRHLQT